MSKIVVAVTDKDGDLCDILHLPASCFDHGLEIVQYLLVLGHQVAWRGNLTFGVAAGLPGQEEETSSCDEDAVTEPARARQCWWVDDSFVHSYLPVNSGLSFALNAS